MRKILAIARNDLRIYLSQRSNLVGADFVAAADYGGVRL
jgi:hypothetical protein